MLAIFEFMLQQLDRTSDRMAPKLHDASVKGDPAIHSGEETKRAFAPDVRGFDRGAILQDSQQRQNGTLGKISVLRPSASQTMSPSLNAIGSRCGSIRLRLVDSNASSS